MGKLTVRAIESAKARDKAYHLADGDGLRIRVSSDGIKTWQVKYSVDDKETTVTLPRRYGPQTDDGHLSLHNARHEAAKIRALARSGVSYQEKQMADRLVRQREREAQEAMERRLTVRKLFERWVELDLSSRKDSGFETKRGLEKDFLSVLGDRYADIVTRADVMAVLDSVKARGANRLANRLMTEIRQMFNFALVREIVASNPTVGIEKKHVGGADIERDRTLSEAEIRTLPAALATANLLDSTKHAIWIMLATCCRIGELTNARKIDTNIDTGAWVISDTKNGKPHTIYLSQFAKYHMQALIELSNDAVWLLPASRNDGPVCVKSITKQIYDRQGAANGTPLKNRSKHIESLKMPGGRWTPHDLRRSAATLMQSLGVLPAVIEACLNHIEQNRIVRTYQRHNYAPEMRNAWMLLGDRLDLLTH